MSLQDSLVAIAENLISNYEIRVEVVRIINEYFRDIELKDKKD